MGRHVTDQCHVAGEQHQGQDGHFQTR
jgi:hypothetical protein